MDSPQSAKISRVTLSG
jgi:hypothetical protein